MGLDLSHLGYKSIMPNLLIPLLYSGPLTAQLLSSTLPFQRNWSYKNNLRPIFTTWVGLRNFIVVSSIIFLIIYCLLSGGPRLPSPRRSFSERAFWLSLIYQGQVYTINYSLPHSGLVLVRRGHLMLVTFF